MEVRWMDGANLGWAVKMAHEIYESCVRQQIATQEEVDQFYQYVRTEYLWQEMTEGRLFVWGAWENGELCGVAAMQSVGHITMLYVRPEVHNRGCAMALLYAMTEYAAKTLHLKQVTINVTPVGAAGFFYRRGFQMIPGGDAYPGFVSLVLPMAGQAGNAHAGQKDRVSYSKRMLSAKWIIGLACGVPALIAVGTFFLTVLLAR